MVLFVPENITEIFWVVSEARLRATQDLAPLPIDQLFLKLNVNGGQ